jgi:hypothetical protein
MYGRELRLRHEGTWRLCPRDCMSRQTKGSDSIAVTEACKLCPPTAGHRPSSAFACCRRWRRGRGEVFQTVFNLCPLALICFFSSSRRVKSHYSPSSTLSLVTSTSSHTRRTLQHLWPVGPTPLHQLPFLATCIHSMTRLSLHGHSSCPRCHLPTVTSTRPSCEPRRIGPASHGACCRRPEHC